MITLHGFAFSNYYNIVKHVLMHKEIPFEEALQFGGTDAYLGISPVGKIPALTTEQGGHLSESSVCCDYLEEAYPDRAPLYPADPFARAQVRQVMRIAELYLELPSRRLLRFAFTNTEAPGDVKQEVREVTQRGIDAMNRLCVFDPYVLGGEMTMADIYLRYVLKVVAMGSDKLGWDIAAEIEGLPAWDAMMAGSDIAKKIDADQDANGPLFFNMLKERLGA